ncbi:hypothetical protein [Kaistella jeonii]|nr:hypothetical protein [Kaistella jeonii]SFB90633.1 hypothetical protein SAMN05421876_103342 [Kaistella jeonii]VEI95785.1 Uncharacterised protein [Kaistella jeonii]
MEITEQIIELKEKIAQIKFTESFDDLKEMDDCDFDVMNLIYNYCLSKNYNTDDFPSKYLDLIENEDEDFEDFLNYDVKSYYVYKVSLLHEDVFQLVKVSFFGTEALETDEFCREGIVISIAILEKDKINLTFNKEDWEAAPPFRPKLPG